MLGIQKFFVEKGGCSNNWTVRVITVNKHMDIPLPACFFLHIYSMS